VIVAPAIVQFEEKTTGVWLVMVVLVIGLAWAYRTSKRQAPSIQK
jgi:hypothetical protein